MALKKLTLLGSTGSIGCNTLDVVRQHPDKFEVVALSANTQVEKLYQQCVEFRPKVVVLANSSGVNTLRDKLHQAKINCEVLVGASELETIASLSEVDMVLAAIVGAAGLLSTLAAARAGKQILLANKEAVVMTGDLLMAESLRHNAVILPVDSEHNAIFQCMPEGYHCGVRPEGVRRVILTASGGPFFDWSEEDLSQATPQQAVKHPNWVMGQKISVDCATMMNKGLEVIEACGLFTLKPEEVEVVVHPQSVVHSMVDYLDGSVLAQCGTPDMRTPIANTMAWPKRIHSGAKPLNLLENSPLAFYPPDDKKFPCLPLAYEALRLGKAATAILNAANEIAVSAFLAGKIKFTDISVINEKVLEKHHDLPAGSIEAIIQSDKMARKAATKLT